MFVGNEYLLNWLAMATLQKKLFGISFVLLTLWKNLWGTKASMNWESLEASGLD